MTDKVYLLAQDPGSVNHGIAVIELSTMRIMSHGLNPWTLTMMVPGVGNQVEAYSNMLYALKRKGCRYAVAERYQTRGIKGLSSELVSAMLGITMMVFPGRSRFVIAAQWKVAYARTGLDLDAFYKEMRPITPHQVDASLMGLWLACRMRKEPLLKHDKLKRLLLSADQPSLNQLRLMRKQKERPGKKKRKSKKGSR